MITHMAGRWHRGVGGGRNRQRREGPKDVIAEPFQYRRHGRTDGAGLLTQIEAEKCLAYDPQGQAHHLLCHIQRHPSFGASLPPLEHRDGRLSHQRAIGREMLAMEGRLDEATLMQPGWPVVGQESPSEKRLEHRVRDEVFVVVARMLLQNVLDALRVRDQVCGREEESQAHHLPQLLRPDQKPQGIALYLACTAKQGEGMVVGRSLASLVPRRPGGGLGRGVRGGCLRLRHRFSSFCCIISYSWSNVEDFFRKENRLLSERILHERAQKHNIRQYDVFLNHYCTLSPLL